MIKKYLVTVPNGTFIAIKYHQRKNLVTIGGHGSLLDEYKFFARTFFGMENPDVTWTQRNKARVTFWMYEKNFDEGMQAIDENGHAIEKVRSHGRMMR